MLKSGAQIVIECLLEQGVNTVFGYPGGQIMDIYDALYDYKDKIKHILTCHEQAAVHAADGYARATGRPSVCLATSGPGATNLVTGIATAYMDSIPLIAITGNVSLDLLGRDSFQETDIQGITMPITKHNYIVKDIKELADTVRNAFRIATSGRKGPVLIDIPKDVASAECEFQGRLLNKYSNKTDMPNDKLHACKELINNAKKPLIFAGGGVISANASQELLNFCNRLNIPVCVSLMGLGVINPSSRYYLGMLGTHGTAEASLAVNECDLLIAAGTRFSDRVIRNGINFAPNARIIHIDIDNAEINKNIQADISICGDVKDILCELTKIASPVQRIAWENEITCFRNKAAKKITDEDLTAKKILNIVDKYISNDTIIVTDVGQHQMWAAKYLPTRVPRGFLTSGGLGTMGFGLGAVIGASIATGKKAVLITGDGSFHMSCNELATAVSNDLDITIFIMNNGALGMVRQWQKMFFDGRVSNTVINRKTDFVKLAQAFGADGARLSVEENIDEIIRTALSSKGVTVLDCIIPIDDTAEMRD